MPLRGRFTRWNAIDPSRAETQKPRASREHTLIYSALPRLSPRSCLHMWRHAARAQGASARGAAFPYRRIDRCPALCPEAEGTRATATRKMSSRQRSVMDQHQRVCPLGAYGWRTRTQRHDRGSNTPATAAPAANSSGLCDGIGSNNTLAMAKSRQYSSFSLDRRRSASRTILFCHRRVAVGTARIPRFAYGSGASDAIIRRREDNMCIPLPPGLGIGQWRQLSTRRGGPPRGGRSLSEKVFAGVVVLVLAAWGLVFGAVTLLLLPFLGLGFFLLRRNFQRGGISQVIAASMARKMAERSMRGGVPGTGVGGSSGGGGIGNVGPMGQWMQRAPTQGILSSVLSSMLGGGIRGMELLGVLQSEVKKRALRHPGLSSAIGGEIQSFSDVEMSTVGTSGGSFSPAGRGNTDGRAGPSRVIKARLRFLGRRSGVRGAGWVEVEMSDWEDRKGEDGTEGMEYDRIFVTLDDGKTFDLTTDSSSEGRTSFSRRQDSFSRVKRRGKSSKRPNEGRTVEAEFHDK